MPFIQRNEISGEIVGVYANMQEGYAEEWAEANDGAVVSFLTPPASVLALTARQLRLGLVLNGFSLDQVTATIDAIPDEQDRAVAKIEWEYASQFERDHHLIAQVGAALGLSPEQIDTMWEHALTL